MNSTQSLTTHYEVSGRPFTESEQVVAWGVLFGQRPKGMAIVPDLRRPFSMTASVTALRGAALMVVQHSPALIECTNVELVEGWAPVLFSISSCERVVSTASEQAVLQAGDGVLAPADGRCSLWSPQASSCMVLVLERQLLLPMLAGGEQKSISLVRRDHEALRLLRAYLHNLTCEPVTSGELQQVAANHILDLVALALGSTRSAAEAASFGGLAAGRLRAAKNYVIANAHRPDLSLDEIAARQGVTTRYLRLLFKQEGTTFSHFVREYRLVCAHRMLRNARYGLRPIGEIAFDAGFGDLAHFNHVFRARFGATPTDIREAGRRDREAGE